jgi:hypothetical protein
MIEVAIRQTSVKRSDSTVRAARRSSGQSDDVCNDALVAERRF